MANTVITGNRTSSVTIGSNEIYINKSTANHDTTAGPDGFGVTVTGQDHYLRIDGNLSATLSAINLTTSNATDTDIRILSGASVSATGSNAVTIGSSLPAANQISQFGPRIINDGSITSSGDAAISLNFLGSEIRNKSNGVITGAEDAIVVYNASTVINDGEIYANGGWAIKSNSGSVIRNRLDGYIEHNNHTGQAIEIGGPTGFEGRLYNEGYLFSEIGSTVVSTQGKTYNYGDMIAGDTGIIANGVIGQDFISNSGTIEAGTYAIDGSDAFKVLAYNSGTLEGDVRFGDGDDVLRNSGTIEGNIDLGDGNDRLDNRGGTITDRVLSTVDLGDGHDIFLGSSGTSARINGGEGNDRFYGGDARDTFYGDAGDDIFFTGAGIDSIRAGAGNDRIYGQGSDIKTLVGGFDDDIIFGGSGDDVILGGEASPLSFSAGTEIEGVDRIYAGDGNDQIHGDGGDDFIYGGDGNDFIIGGYGDDRLYGQEGDDDFFRDFGNDFIVGGAGIDEMLFTDFVSTDVSIVEDADGVVTVTGLTSLAGNVIGTDTLVDIEFLVFDDTTIDVALL